MVGVVIEAAIGLTLFVAGILGMAGKISMINSSVARRASEEKVRSAGKKVGLGVFISGCTILTAAIVDLFVPDIADIIMAFGFLPGAIIAFNAVMKLKGESF